MMRALAKWMLVYPGEGRVVSYVVLLNFIVGIGMMIGNTSSDALFFKRFGVEYMPHMLIASSLLMVVFGTAYASMADRIRASTLSIRILGSLAIFLVILWVTVRMGGGKAAIVGYYLCYAIVTELLLAHLSHYYLGFFDATQSRRLFPLISAGQRLGAVLGGFMVSAALTFLETEDMMLLWVITLLASMLMVIYYHRQDIGRKTVVRKHGGGKVKMFASIYEGLEYAKTSRLLQFTGAGVFVLILICSTQDYLVSTIFTRHFNDEHSLAAFLGVFYAAVNATTLVLQTLLTSRMLQRFGLKVVNMVFPVSSFVSFGLLAFSPTLIPAMIGRLNYAGLMRAFRRPTFDLYFHGFPSYMQGRARAAIVSFVLPMGLATSGALMMMIPQAYVTVWLGWAGLGLSVIYIAIKWKKHQAYGESLGNLIKKQVFSLSDGSIQELGHLDTKISDGIVASLRNIEDENTAADYVDMLIQGAPERVGNILLEIAPRFSNAFQDRMLKNIARLKPDGWQQYARRCFTQGDNHLSCSALLALLEEKESPEWKLLHKWLDKEAPTRLKGAAVQVVLSGKEPALLEKATGILSSLLSSSESSDLITGLAAIRELGDLHWLDSIKRLLSNESASVRLAAIQALGALSHLTFEDTLLFWPAIKDHSPVVRAATVKSISNIPDLSFQVELLALAAYDPDFKVRHAVEEYVKDFRNANDENLIGTMERYFDDFEVQRLILKMAANSGRNENDHLFRSLLARNLDIAAEKKHLAHELEAVSRNNKSVNNMAARFITEVLEEEVQRHLDMSLQALEQLDEANAVRTIRAAWASRNRHLRSLALESLRHRRNDAIIQRMLLLLEAQLSHNWQEVISQDSIRTWDTVLKKCSMIGSRWLKQCVFELSPELSLQERQTG